MAEPFLSEIRMFGFNWAPSGWAKCDGQSLTINDNQALFSLLGTQYGGDGRVDFNLPDMRGRAPVSFGVSPTDGIHYAQGSFGGQEYVHLSVNQMAQHTHAVRATNNEANSKSFDKAIFATSVSRGLPTEAYTPGAALTSLNPSSVSTNGGNGSHYNVQPSLVISYCIAITGLFPSRN